MGRRAEKALRAKTSRDLPKRHAEALAAASLLSRAWILYHRARAGAVLTQVSPSYGSRPNQDLVASAIMFSQPAMDTMLTELEAGRGVGRFRRQLLVLCRELAHAARRDGVPLTDYDALRRLRNWVRKQTKLGGAASNDRAAFPGCFGSVSRNRSSA